MKKLMTFDLDGVEVTCAEYVAEVYGKNRLPVPEQYRREIEREKRENGEVTDDGVQAQQ